MIYNIIKEELNQEKFKRYIYRYIVNNYVIYPHGDSYYDFFNKENEEWFNINRFRNMLLNFFGDKYDIIIMDVLAKIGREAREFQNKTLNKELNIDLSGNEPKFKTK